MLLSIILYDWIVYHYDLMIFFLLCRFFDDPAISRLGNYSKLEYWEPVLEVEDISTIGHLTTSEQLFQAAITDDNNQV